MRKLYETGIPTLTFLVYAVSLVGYATYRVFSPEPPIISVGTASAYASLLALPAVAVGLYVKRFIKQDG